MSQWEIESYSDDDNDDDDDDDDGLGSERLEIKADSIQLRTLLNNCVALSERLQALNEAEVRSSFLTVAMSFVPFIVAGGQ